MRNGGDQSKKYENNFVVSKVSSSTSFLGNGSNLFVCSIWSCTNKAWCYKEIVDGLTLKACGLIYASEKWFKL